MNFQRGWYRGIIKEHYFVLGYKDENIDTRPGEASGFAEAGF